MTTDELLDTFQEALTSSSKASLLSDVYMKALAQNPLSAHTDAGEHLVLSAHADTIVLLERLLEILRAQSIGDVSNLGEIKRQIEQIRQKVRTF